MSSLAIDTTNFGSAFNKKTLKTLEFYILVLGAIGPWIANWASTQIDNRDAAIGNILAAAVFSAARGLGKMGADTKDFWHTTEFYAVLLGSATAAVTAGAGTISWGYWFQLQGLLAAVASIMNGLRKNKDLAAGNITALDLAGETDLYVQDNVDPDLEGNDALLAGQPHADPNAPVTDVTPPTDKKK